LEVGKDADLILLNTKKPHLTPLNNIYSALVYSAKSSDVDTVFCKGRTLMEHREILFIGEDQLRFQFNESWNKIQQRTGGTPS
jgi:5-methylthioadenosine/S-adenosylhomocysteine deaminase